MKTQYHHSTWKNRYLSFYTPLPTDVKLAPKCQFFQVLRYDIEFSFMGGTGKNLKIKIYPTCFEKVFFRKNSLRGLQWYVFPLHILYGIGEKMSAKFSDGETALLLCEEIV